MAASQQTETFQHYQVLRRPDGSLFELGRGAMGVTYKAFDTNLRCDVALKVINALHLDSETARARFLREARAAAGLRHRNVASVYHLGNDEQSFFYAMEWVDGLTVESMVKDQGAALGVADALQITLQTARALGAASRQGLVHRDIKPANIMVAREDDEDDQFVVKVIDFGLARSAVGGEGSANITIGGFVGTPQYASPEQLEEKDLDVRSDIYSLGVTLWFMLAARPPFSGPLGSVFIQQMTKEPPWEHVASAPEPVKALLAHVLKKDPDQRPQTAIALRREIEACLKALPPELNRPTVVMPPRSTPTQDTLASKTSAAGQSTPPPTATPSETPSSVPAPRVFSAGSLLANRYELAEFTGEGTNGRVFRAQDLGANRRPVAVKIFHLGVLGLEAERRRLRETIEKLQAASHPHLKQVVAFSEASDSQFLVEEWVNGFSLVDVLRSRGQLGVRETFQLLGQMASAADFAGTQGLTRLELSLHQILAHFPPAAGSGETTANRSILSSTLDHWPDFSLKLDALGITREAGDSVTYTGDMTLMPDALSLGRDTQTSIRGLVESTFLFSLGALVYELLSGAPPALGRAGGGRSVRYVALPALNEAANAVLRQVLSPNPTFASGTEFFQALCEASGVLLPVEEAAPTALAEDWTHGGHAETMILDEPEVAGTLVHDEAAEAALREAAQARAEEQRAAQERAAEEARQAAERHAAEEAEIAAEEARINAEEARVAAERRAAEEARLAEQARLAEEARLAAEQRAAEEARIAEEERAAAEARLAEQRAAEKARLAAEKKAADEAREAARLKAAEDARIAAEKRAVEEARLAEQRAAEKARLAAEKKAADEAREAARLKAAEDARIAAEKRALEDARLAEERAAEKARAAAAKLAADQAREAAKKQAAEEARLAAEARAAEKARQAAEKRAADEARKAAQAQAAEEARLARAARIAETAPPEVSVAQVLPAGRMAPAERAPSGLPKAVLAGAGVVVAVAAVSAFMFLRPAHNPVPTPSAANAAPERPVAVVAVATPAPVVASTPAPTAAPVLAIAEPSATPLPVVLTTPAPEANVPPTPAPASSAAPVVAVVEPTPTPAPVVASTPPPVAAASASPAHSSHTAAKAPAAHEKAPVVVAAADKKVAKADAKPTPKKQKAAQPQPTDAPQSGNGAGFMR